MLIPTLPNHTLYLPVPVSFWVYKLYSSSIPSFREKQLSQGSEVTYKTHSIKSKIPIHNGSESNDNWRVCMTNLRLCAYSVKICGAKVEISITLHIQCPLTPSFSSVQNLRLYSIAYFGLFAYYEPKF